jgi:hypothetical protein
MMKMGVLVDDQGGRMRRRRRMPHGNVRFIATNLK